MFPNINRISHSLFEQFFRTGTRHHSTHFEIRYTPSPTLHVSVVVPKKVIKSSADRNRVRRQVYHVLKPLLQDTTGVYMVFIKKNFPSNLSQPLKDELETLVGGI